MNALFAAGQSGGGADWSKLEDKLKTAGSATNDFLQICQKYWYIPMFFALIIVAGLVLVGGQQGRLQRKKRSVTSSFRWQLCSAYLQSSTCLRV